MPNKLEQSDLKILRDKNFAFLATIKEDGSPHVAPVWVDTDGENVLVNTAIGRVKEKNIARDPRVAIAVAESSNPYHFVSVEGTVEKKTTGKEAEDHIDKMAKKYTGAEKYPNRQPGERRVILIIKPERVKHMG